MEVAASRYKLRMWEILSWLLFIIFIAGLLVVGGLLLRGYLTTGNRAGALTGGFFGPKPEKRLDVVDQANVDGRRRLVLIRRDNIEHLIMTGGPVDVVIETGIATTSTSNSGSIETVATAHNRPARTFSSVATEKAS